MSTNPNIAAHEVWRRTRFGEPATGKVTEQDLDRLQAWSPCKYGDKFCPCQDGDACHYEGRSAFPDPLPTPEQIEEAKAVETLPLTRRNLAIAVLIVAIGAWPVFWEWI